MSVREDKSATPKTIPVPTSTAPPPPTPPAAPAPPTPPIARLPRKVVPVIVAVESIEISTPPPSPTPPAAPLPPAPPTARLLAKVQSVIGTEAPNSTQSAPRRPPLPAPPGPPAFPTARISVKVLSTMTRVPPTTQMPPPGHASLILDGAPGSSVPPVARLSENSEDMAVAAPKLLIAPPCPKPNVVTPSPPFAPMASLPTKRQWPTVRVSLLLSMAPPKADPPPSPPSARFWVNVLPFRSAVELGALETAPPDASPPTMPSPPSARFRVKLQLLTLSEAPPT